jgi:hypothetical protein
MARELGAEVLRNWALNCWPWVPKRALWTESVGRCLLVPMGGWVIVWDIETVPDLGRFAQANGFEGKSDAEVREALGDKFPKHIYHSIVSIGALVARQEEGSWIVTALGAPHVGERPEKALISSFVERIAELKPQLRPTAVGSIPHCDGIARGGTMADAAQRRGELIQLLERALGIAEELGDGATEYLIERALDEARAGQFRPAGE